RKHRRQLLELHAFARGALWYVRGAHECFELAAAGSTSKIKQWHGLRLLNFKVPEAATPPRGASTGLTGVPANARTESRMEGRMRQGNQLALATNEVGDGASSVMF